MGQRKSFGVLTRFTWWVNLNTRTYFFHCESVNCEDISVFSHWESQYPNHSNLRFPIFCRASKLFWCASYLHWRWPHRWRCIQGIARQGWWLWNLSVSCPKRNTCMLFFERPFWGTMIVKSHRYLLSYMHTYVHIFKYSALTLALSAGLGRGLWPVPMNWCKLSSGEEGVQIQQLINNWSQTIVRNPWSQIQLWD